MENRNCRCRRRCRNGSGTLGATDTDNRCNNRGTLGATSNNRCNYYPDADALEAAYNAGYNNGYCDGVEAGREEGYCEGYEQGARDACQDTKQQAINCIRRIDC